MLTLVVLISPAIVHSLVLSNINVYEISNQEMASHSILCEFPFVCSFLAKNAYFLTK